MALVDLNILWFYLYYPKNMFYECNLKRFNIIQQEHDFREHCFYTLKLIKTRHED